MFRRTRVSLKWIEVKIFSDLKLIQRHCIHRLLRCLGDGAASAGTREEALRAADERERIAKTAEADRDGIEART